MRKKLENPADFCLEIDFEKGLQASPSRIFRVATELIEAFQDIDNDLVQSIDVRIRPSIILEDIESGSLEIWLKNFLEIADDDALKIFDWKKVVGGYLVKAKYILVDFLQDKTEISSREQIQHLSQKLMQAAKETEILRIPMYSEVPDHKITGFVHRITEAVQHLDQSDEARLRISESEEALFNIEFNFSPESIEELITRETIESDQRMILKVKKPDYLGESMWDFRHEGKTIRAKVLDDDWLSKFQSRQEEVRPGDALRAQVKIEVKYGFDGEVVSTRYAIIEVIETIHLQGDTQAGLF